MSFREFFQILWIIRTIIFSIWSFFEKWWFLSNYKSFVRFTKSLTLSKKRLAQVFSCEFCEISQNTFSAEHFRTTASLVLFLYSYNYLFINNIFVSVCHVLQSRLPSYSNSVGTLILLNSNNLFCLLKIVRPSRKIVIARVRNLLIISLS